MARELRRCKERGAELPEERNSGLYFLFMIKVFNLLIHPLLLVLQIPKRTEDILTERICALNESLKILQASPMEYELLYLYSSIFAYCHD